MFYADAEQAIKESLKEKAPLFVLVKDGADDDDDDDTGPLITALKEKTLREPIAHRTVPLCVTKGNKNFELLTQLVAVGTTPCVMLIHGGQVVWTLTDETKSQLLESLLKWPEIESLKDKKIDTTQVSIAKDEGSEGAQKKQQQPAKNTSTSQQSSASSTSTSTSTTPAVPQPQNTIKKDHERERIRKQIEADKAERRASKSPAPQGQGHNPSQSRQGQNKAVRDESKCALSVRKFDGSAEKTTFDSVKTLTDVRRWLDQTVAAGNEAYTFVQNIPHHLFTPAEEQQSLKQLKLTPSATLILKPVKNHSDAYATGSWLQSGANWVTGTVSSIFGMGYQAVNQEQQPEPNRVHTVHDRDDRTTYNGNQLSLEDDNKKNE